jgi:Na+-transporting NADH:ubiquinone oxidoreductase subunit NqrF
MTDMQKSRRPWQGETGYVNREMLAKYIGDLAAPIYYSAGPPGLVAAMQKMLSGAGISEDDIVTEEFPGY